MGILQCQECGADATYDIQIDIQRSPVPHLLQSYDAPNAGEIIYISGLLVDARRTLSVVDAEIQKISTAWSYLREKRDALQKSIDRHDSLLAPIRRLPEDVLRHIFFLSLPNSHEKSSFDNNISPLLLTQVCEPWTRCAISSQRLWASFTIKSHAAPQVPLVKTWLSRAKSILLSPHLELTGTNAEARRAWPAIAEAVQYCDRWDNLTVQSPISTLRRFGSVRGRLYSLYRLSITLIPGSDDHQILDAFQFAPRLRQVTLFNISLEQLRLPWQQIISLVLTPSSHDLSLLRSGLQPLVSLAVLSFHYMGVTTYTPSLMPVTLSRLICLVVDMPVKIGNLFAIIRCPALRSLLLTVSDHSWICGAFVSFFQTLLSLKLLEIVQAAAPEEDGSAVFPVSITDPLPSIGTMPTMTTLSLHFEDMGPQAMSSSYFSLLAALTHLQNLEIHLLCVDDETPARLVQYLLAVPTVTTLWLDCGGMPLISTFITAMIYTAPSPDAKHGPCLLPRLKSLDINAEFPYEHLVEVMMSRNGISGVAQLEHVVPPDGIWSFPDLLSRLEQSGILGTMQNRVGSK